MSTTAMCAAGIVCAVFLMGLFIWLVLEDHKKNLQLAEKDKTIEHKNQFICRLMHELYKAKGISGPFVMPAEEPEQGPDFDVAQIFAVENATECEEPEKRCDSGCKAELDAGWTNRRLRKRTRPLRG